jgi:TolB-like protein/Flp pilus assembly protein TadD
MFGGFQFCDGNGRKIEITDTKAALLLAYLAMRQGAAISREKLTGLLWSDREEKQARGSLRHAIWALRRALKGVEPYPLVIEGDTIALDLTAIEADTVNFEKLLADGSQEALQSAVTLYCGEFLEGFRIRDPAFQAVLGVERERLHELAVDVCVRLLDRQLQSGVNDAAVATAKRLLTIDPFQETAHRTLMEYHANRGQLGLALKQYQSCRDALQRGLGVEPDAKTEQLLTRVRSARPRDPDRNSGRSETLESSSRSREPPAQREKPSIAVLPFVNLSDDPKQEYFSDGITGDIITALSKLRWFLVIARNSTFVYKGKSFDIKQIRRELGVRYVLEGSVRKSGNRLRVSADLVDAASGVQHWGQHYDRELTDIFELQDDIARSVTAAIEPKLVAMEGMRAQRRSPEDLGAWELVSRAMAYYGQMTTEDSQAAIEILKQAVGKHPDYGPAHSMLAFALLVSGHVGWIPESRDFHYAAELAHRAARLDEEDPWAYLALGYLAFTERQTDEAVREYMRAIDRNPNFATAYGYLGWTLVFDGQSDEAIRYFQQALRMSPHDPLRAFFYSGTGVAHYYASQYSDAVEWARKAIRERPEFAAAHRILCASLAQADRAEETKQAMKKLRKVQPNVSISWIKRYVPYTSRAMDQFLDGMSKAGLN